MSEPDLQELSRDELLKLVRKLLLVVQEQQKRIEHLEEEVARLRGGSAPPPSPQEPPFFVKPNRQPKDPSQPKPPRKKRPHGFARRRGKPDCTLEHAPECCSECGRELRGGWMHASRQVLELPETPVLLIEHQFLARYCGVCHRREFSRPDLSGVVVGHSRIGVRLASFIAYLRTVCRMAVRTVQSMLKARFHLHLSTGEIVRVSHAVAQVGQKTYEGLLEQVRSSKVAQADETSAREDGINGYLWSLSTKDVRYYHRDKSRSAAVIQQLLGYEPMGRSLKRIRAARERNLAAGEKKLQFRGKLVTDFYSAYSWYKDLQRCMVHLDRDLDELAEKHKDTEKHKDEELVGEWVRNVLDVIQRAKEYQRECLRRRNEKDEVPHHVRRRQRRAFEKEAEELARPYLKSGLPQQGLAQRIRRHLGELFVFVEYPDVPADNNAAERAIRPFVVQRKVSGGTRSARGSQTQVVLLSLFQTWALRGQDALQECRQMLTRRATPALA